MLIDKHLVQCCALSLQRPSSETVFFSRQATCCLSAAITAASELSLPIHAITAQLTLQLVVLLVLQLCLPYHCPSASIRSATHSKSVFLCRQMALVRYRSYTLHSGIWRYLPTLSSAPDTVTDLHSRLSYKAQYVGNQQPVAPLVKLKSVVVIYNI